MVVQKMQDFYEYFGVDEYDLYTADMLGIIPTPGVMCSEQSKQEIDEIPVSYTHLRAHET